MGMVFIHCSYPQTSKKGNGPHARVHGSHAGKGMGNATLTPTDATLTPTDAILTTPGANLTGRALFRMKFICKVNL